MEMVKKNLLVVTNLRFIPHCIYIVKPINIFAAFENKNGMLNYISAKEEKN